MRWFKLPCRIAMTICFGVACAAPDEVSAPSLSVDVTQPSHYQSYNGQVLTLIDEVDGTHYTLDVNAREIRFADGRILGLDFDQTTQALAAFHGTLVADSVSAETETFYDPGCYEAVCEYSATDSAVTFTWLFADDGKKGKKVPKEKDKVRSYGGFSLQSYSDVCSDVANAALGSRLEYRRQRSAPWRDVWDYALAEGTNAVRRVLPPGTAAAAMFGTKLTEHLHARVGVSVLAFMWNSYGCSNRVVTAGPIIRGFGGGGGGGRDLVCHYEWMEISFDDRQTWHAVYATICEYVQN